MPDDAPLYLGLISGHQRRWHRCRAGAFRAATANSFSAAPMPGMTALRARLIALGQGGEANSLDELGELDTTLARAFADAAMQAIAEPACRMARSAPSVRMARPCATDPNPSAPFTWQMGDGNLIAERSGITTVADFRRRDVAAGGHGAPLMPAFHAAMLRSESEDRAVLNLGGIANFTLLPRAGEVRGFDTGPANALMDAWCERHTGQAYDAGGALAASGTRRCRPAGALAGRAVVRPAAAQEHRSRTVPPALAGITAAAGGRVAGGRAGHAAGTERGHRRRCPACHPARDHAGAGMRRRRAQHRR